MPKGLSLAVHEAVLNCYFNATSITAPTNLYCSLHTADPGDDGQTSNEISGNNYSRKNHNDWTAAAETGVGTSIMFVENGSTITFDQAIGGAWGTITHVGIWTDPISTAASAFVGRGELGTSRNVAENDIPYFPAGEVDVQITETA